MFNGVLICMKHQVLQEHDCECSAVFGAFGARKMIFQNSLSEPDGRQEEEKKCLRIQALGFEQQLSMETC